MHTFVGGDGLRYRRAGDFIVIRLDEGERVIDDLENVCASEGVTSGVVLSAIGGVKKGTLIYRRGCQGDFDEHIEVIGNGNVSELGGRPKVHLHIVGGNDKGTKAGHLVEGEASVFLEVVIHALHGFSMRRKLDEGLLSQEVLNPYVLEP